MRSSAKNLGVVDLVSKNHSKETGVGGRKKRTLKIPKFCLFSYDMISYIISYDEIMQVNRKKIRRLFFRPKKFTTQGKEGYAMLYKRHLLSLLPENYCLPPQYFC